MRTMAGRQRMCAAAARRDNCDSHQLMSDPTLDMKQLLSLMYSAVLAALVMTFVSGCAQPRRIDASAVAAQNDIHERLSAVITRDGFSHGLRSQRDGWQDFDSIYIRVALDALKRRHSSLDNLMKDIGRICALPIYAHLPIRIEIGAGDEADRKYLYDMLMPEIEGKANITVVSAADDYNDITIAVRHRGPGSR